LAAPLPAFLHSAYNWNSAAGVVTREYVWLDDMPLAVAADLDTATPNLWFVHADHLDRPIRMTDGAKSVVWNALFLPFGAVDVILGPASNNLRFPGQYFLVESGLHYNWHRHYDPTLGRYIQADPNRDVLATRPINLDGSILTINGGKFGGSQLALSVATAGDFNLQVGSELPEFIDGSSLYAYSRSAPTMNIDPRGLDSSGPNSSPSGQQMCTAQTCYAAHRACLLSSRDARMCTRAYWHCSQGFPTIFGPGLYGVRG
jgi:RHS repeat-associated protein